MNHSYNDYKFCIVPDCRSSSITTPKKIFVVPNNKEIRKTWLSLAKRIDPHSTSSNSTMYFCEDHFDIENDMENYIKYKLVGGSIKLKQGIVPHKFKCQQEKEDKPQRSAVQKRNRIEQGLPKSVPRRPGAPWKVKRGADLPNDMENYMEHHVMDSETQVHMKPGCVPSKFECQKTKQTDPKECQYMKINERKRLTEKKKKARRLEIGDTSSDGSETDDALNEDMCVIKQEIEIEDDPLDNPMCGACLGQGRSLQPLGALAAVYCALVPQETDVEAVKICEECAASLRACAKFQKQAVRARKVLRANARGQTTDLQNTEKQSTLPSTSYSTTMPKPKEIGSELAPEVTCAIKVEIDLPEDTSAINEDINLENDPVYEKKYEIKSRQCTPKPRKRKKTDDLPKNTEPLPTQPPVANVMCVEIDLQEKIVTKELPRRKGPS